MITNTQQYSSIRYQAASPDWNSLLKQAGFAKSKTLFLSLFSQTIEPLNTTSFFVQHYSVNSRALMNIPKKQDINAISTLFPSPILPKPPKYILPTSYNFSHHSVTQLKIYRMQDEYFTYSHSQSSQIQHTQPSTSSTCYSLPFTYPFFLLLVDQYELENIQLLLSIMCKSHNSLTTHMSHNKDLQLTVLTLYKTSHKFLPTFLKLFVKNVKTDLPIHSFISYHYSIYMKNNA